MKGYRVVGPGFSMDFPDWYSADAYRHVGEVRVNGRAVCVPAARPDLTYVEAAEVCAAALWRGDYAALLAGRKAQLTAINPRCDHENRYGHTTAFEDTVAFESLSCREGWDDGPEHDGDY